jgi:hypothetical protein
VEKAGIAEAWTVAPVLRRRYRFNADERRNAPIDSDADLVSGCEGVRTVELFLTLCDASLVVISNRTRMRSARFGADPRLER